LLRGDTEWDVTLKSTDGEELHAHKCVLASQSEYFESMFAGGFRETTQDVVQINDISGVILKNMIDFMYTGVLVKIEEDNALVMIFFIQLDENIIYSHTPSMLNAINILFFKGILNAADMFQMDDVRDECLKFYKYLLHDGNCLEIKEIADTRAMTSLSEMCYDYALKRFLLVDISCLYSKFRAWIKIILTVRQKLYKSN